MKRRTTVISTLIAGILTLTLVMTGCGSSAGTSADAAGSGAEAASGGTSSGAASDAASGAASDTDAAATLGGELNLFNWTEYMPESVLDAFEEETGVKVNYTTYSSNEEMLAKIQSGEQGMYDITIASDYMVSTMIAEDLLEKLDGTKIPNSANVDPAFLKQNFDPENAWSLPYMIAPALLCYNSSLLPEGIASYKDLLSPALAGSLVLLDDQRMIIGMAELANGVTVNETDPAKLQVSADWLTSLKPNIKLFDSDSPKSAMISGETASGYMWSAEVILAMSENPDIVPVYAEEGTIMMIDNFVIPKGAKNVDNANAFINFVLQPEISALVSAEYPYINPNKAALPLLPESFTGNPASNPPASEFEKSVLLESLGESAKLYDDLWTAFKNQ